MERQNDDWQSVKSNNAWTNMSIQKCACKWKTRLMNEWKNTTDIFLMNKYINELLQHD